MNIWSMNISGSLLGDTIARNLLSLLPHMCPKHIHSEFISFGGSAIYIFFSGYWENSSSLGEGSLGCVKVAATVEAGTIYRSTGWRISFILPRVLLKGIHSYHRYVLPFITPSGIFRSENRRSGCLFIRLRPQCLIFPLTSTSLTLGPKRVSRDRKEEFRCVINRSRRIKIDFLRFRIAFARYQRISPGFFLDYADLSFIEIFSYIHRFKITKAFRTIEIFSRREEIYLWNMLQYFFR